MAKLMEGGSDLVHRVKRSSSGRKPSFKGSRSRKKSEDEEGFRSRSVREVIRLFEARHQGARVVAVKRQQANAKPSDAVILVRRSSKPRSRVKPVLHPKPARLSLPKDLSLLDEALGAKPEKSSVSKQSLKSDQSSNLDLINPPLEIIPEDLTSNLSVSRLFEKTTPVNDKITDTKSSHLSIDLRSSAQSDLSDGESPSTSKSTDPPDKMGTELKSPPQPDTTSNPPPPKSSLYKLLASTTESAQSNLEYNKSSLFKIANKAQLSQQESMVKSSKEEDFEKFPIESHGCQTVAEENHGDIQPKTSSLYRLLKQTSVESTSTTTSSTLTPTPSEVEKDILHSIDYAENAMGSTPGDAKTNSTGNKYVNINSMDSYNESSMKQLPELPLRSVPSLPSATKVSYENEGYSNSLEQENNYEVIDDEEAIYDDVVNLRSEGLYEIIYTSHIDSDGSGSVDQSNSIYGMRPPSEASTGSGGSGGDGSCASDDWVDLEQHLSSDHIKTERILVCTYDSDQECKQLPNSKFYCDYREGNSDESDGAHYESVEIVDDDSALCDDFSDDTDSETESLSSGKTTPNLKLKNGRGSNGSVHKEESIYCLLREAGKKTWSKSLQWVSRISQPQAQIDEKTVNSKWLTLNKKNKRRHKSLSTFYINNNNNNNPPSTPPLSNNLPQIIVAGDIRRHSMALRPTSPPPPPPSINDKKYSGSMRELVESSYNIGYLSSSSNPIYDDKKSDTSSEHGSSQGSDINLRFADEPLYQFYEAGVFEREKAELEVDEENYEELGLGSRPSALDLVTFTQLNRTLWCQVPQVVASGLLDSLSSAEKLLQEAKFELMTSEASYYKSLTVLEKHFAHSSTLKDTNVLSKVDYRTLFSNVSPVRKCSELVLNALDKCWQESILLEGICDVVSSLASQQFQTYVKYCTNQVSIEKSLKKLKASNTAFVNALTTLEKAEICHSLTLSSFLLLPMQRITRMPLLLDAILTKLTPQHSEYTACQSALQQLNKIVFECNEAARKTERYEELAALSRALVFPAPLKPLPLLSASRWLVRSGVVNSLNSLEQKLTLTKRLTAKNQKYTLFLFTDYLIIAKKKSDENYSVLDYCARNLVQMRMLEDTIPGKFLVELTMLENCDKKTVEMVLCCGSESGRERWLRALNPPPSDNEGETLYEDWDCPQVTALHPFTPTQPDELQLRSGDSVNVLRKLNDGWYFGERIRDGERGWFPGNFTIEIASAHMRARNLKLRYRFLALTSSYIQQNMNKNL